jgi:hypothetical protein
LLSVYRRHREKCPHAEDRVSRKCRCALWAKGTVEGKLYQKSLKTRNFERAEQLKRNIENGSQPKQPKGITIKDALTAFIKDCEQRNLSRNTLRKYRTLESCLNTFGQDHGIVRCSDLTADSIRDFKSTRRLSALTTSKELGHLRTFFQFCIDREWITKNPAKSIKAPQLKINPRLPFSEKEIQNILSKAEDDRELAFLFGLVPKIETTS